MQKIVSKNTLYKNVLNFKVGDTLNLDLIKEKLVLLGYERTKMADVKSTFSIRGGIIDIATSEEQGVRIELWGDEIDSIRFYNTMSQRSSETIKEIAIYPAFEFVLDNNLEEVINKIEDETDIEQIREGNYLSKIDKYFNLFYKDQESILTYLNDNYIVFIDEIGKVKARCDNILKDNENIIKALVEKQKTVPDSLKLLSNYLEFLETIKKKQTVYLEKQDIGFVDKQSMHAKRNGYSFSYREVNFFRSSMDLLFKEIQEAAGEKTVIILCGNSENIKKTKNILIENVPNSAKYIDSKNENKIILTQGTISSGFECYDFNLLVICVSEVFNTPAKKKRISSEFKQGETVIFSELKPGDYIVHRTNGIGEFLGVNTIKTGAVTKDYIKLRYKDGDILYIPTDSLDNIRKYIGTGNRAPKINRLRKQRVGTNKSKSKE